MHDHSPLQRRAQGVFGVDRSGALGDDRQASGSEGAHPPSQVDGVPQDPKGTSTGKYAHEQTRIQTETEPSVIDLLPRERSGITEALTARSGHGEISIETASPGRGGGGVPRCSGRAAGLNMTRARVARVTVIAPGGGQVTVIADGEAAGQ